MQSQGTDNPDGHSSAVSIEVAQPLTQINKGLVNPAHGEVPYSALNSEIMLQHPQDMCDKQGRGRILPLPESHFDIAPLANISLSSQKCSKVKALILDEQGVKAPTGAV